MPVAIVKREEVTYSGKIFQVVRQHLLAGNQELEFEIARRSPGIRLIISHDRKMMITREYRYELQGYDYRLPGGKVFDTLEQYLKTPKKRLLADAIKAAKKEAMEEAGIEVKDLELFCITKAGATIEWDLFYFVIKDFRLAKQQLERGEIIKTEWKSFEEVKKLCLTNSIKEDRTIGVLLRFLEISKPGKTKQENPPKNNKKTII